MLLLGKQIEPGAAYLVVSLLDFDLCCAFLYAQNLCFFISTGPILYAAVAITVKIFLLHFDVHWRSG
jgi:hypothetical protein